jgi:hypothetical protein
VSDNKQADAKMVADGLAFEIYRRVCECLCVHLSELSFSSIAQQLTGSCSKNEQFERSLAFFTRVDVLQVVMDYLRRSRAMFP